MKVNELGEIGLIKRATKAIQSKYLGDDCAVLDLGQDYLVVTTDMLHRVTDFPREMTGEDIGWMSVAVSLSDVAAMGAKPAGVVAALGLPGDTDVEFFDGIVKGMNDCCKAYGTEIVGGDTDQHAELTIVTTALGRVDKDKVKLRSGAKPGDLLCVTGSLGTPAAGFKVMVRDGIADRIKHPELFEDFFKPKPRVREGILLSKYKGVTAMMDVSDGLGKSVYELSSASKVGFEVDADALPMKDEARKAAGDRAEMLDMAICFGGEFELIFTVKPETVNDIKDVKFTVVGKATDSGLILNDGGKRSEIKCRGYEHLKKKSDTVH